MSQLEKVVVTGGAGFIGSNLVDALIEQGKEVHVIDNFSTGRREFLNPKAELHELDLCDESETLGAIVNGADSVYHLAANADVRSGMTDIKRDINQNVIATLRVAQACAENTVKEVIFSSTGAVYGDAVQHPTPETAQFPIQTSLYGVSKTAAEGVLSTFAANGLFHVCAFRFVSVLGHRYMHGHVIDFVRQLHQDPSALTVLGDGSQRKSYMDVKDCVRALVTLRGAQGFEVFNLGADDYCTVRDSVAWITQAMGVEPKISYGIEKRGWVGDNPFTWLDVSKAKNHGWVAEKSISHSVQGTVSWLLENTWALAVQDFRK